MSTEEQYIQQRREKLQKLRDLGVDVYPRRFKSSKTIPGVLQEFKDKTAEQLEEEKTAKKLAAELLQCVDTGKLAS